MKNNEVARARISAIIGDIERLHAELGPNLVRDPADREAYDIVARIERKLKSQQDAVE